MHSSVLQHLKWLQIEGLSKWGSPRLIIRYFKNVSGKTATPAWNKMTMKCCRESTQDQILNSLSHNLQHNLQTLKYKMPERLIPKPPHKDAFRLSRMSLLTLKAACQSIGLQNSKKLITKSWKDNDKFKRKNLPYRRPHSQPWGISPNLLVAILWPWLLAWSAVIQWLSLPCFNPKIVWRDQILRMSSISPLIISRIKNISVAMMRTSA